MKLKDKLLIWRLESSISSSKYFVPFQVLGMLHPTKSENLSTSAKQSCQCFCSAYFSTPHTEIKVYDAPVPTNIFMFLGRCFYHVFASSISYIEKIFSFQWSALIGVLEGECPRKLSLILGKSPYYEGLYFLKGLLCFYTFKNIFERSSDRRPATFFKKRLWHWCFPVYFAKFIRTPFLQNSSARLLLLWVDLINHVKCTINIWGTQTHIWRLFYEIFGSSHWERWW